MAKKLTIEQNDSSETKTLQEWIQLLIDKCTALINRKKEDEINISWYNHNIIGERVQPDNTFSGKIDIHLRAMSTVLDQLASTVGYISDLTHEESARPDTATVVQNLSTTVTYLNAT